MAISFGSFSIGFCREVVFLSVFSFYKRFKVGEVYVPEIAILVEPCIHGAQRFRIEAVNPATALPVFLHQMGPSQQPQVLGDGRPGNGKRLRDRSRRLAAGPQQIEDGPPGGIGQSLKRRLRRIRNCTMTHNA